LPWKRARNATRPDTAPVNSFVWTDHVSPEHAGKRLDAYLHERLPEYSRSRLQSWIKDGHAKVDDAIVKPSHILRVYECVTVEPAALPALAAEPEDLPLRVVYEDEDVIVVDKPAGMVVHAGAGNHSGTLVNALLHHFERLSTQGGDLRPGIVHRIDRDTSGLLVVARTDPAHQSLARQFHDRKVQKQYIALVHGRLKNSSGTITAPITRDPVRRTRMTCKLGKGRSAITHYEILEQFERHTLLKIKIETGRTHQIRVHLTSLHHPIVGDGLYGAPRLDRFFLHAHQLSFASPSTGAMLRFESPLPREFVDLLEQLRSGTARIGAS
jgi:23S rRNA pseudouridine1911/1915/1917 synthase